MYICIYICNYENNALLVITTMAFLATHALGHMMYSLQHVWFTGCMVHSKEKFISQWMQHILFSIHTCIYVYMSWVIQNTQSIQILQKQDECNICMQAWKQTNALLVTPQWLFGNSCTGVQDAHDVLKGMSCQ